MTDEVPTDGSTTTSSAGLRDDDHAFALFLEAFWKDVPVLLEPRARQEEREMLRTAWEAGREHRERGAVKT